MQVSNSLIFQNSTMIVLKLIDWLFKNRCLNGTQMTAHCWMLPSVPFPHHLTNFPSIHIRRWQSIGICSFVLFFSHPLYQNKGQNHVYIYVYGIIWIDTVHQTFAYMWVSDTPTYHIKLIISIKCNWFPWMFHEYSMNIALVSHWYAIIPEIPLLCH